MPANNFIYTCRRNTVVDCPSQLVACKPRANKMETEEEKGYSWEGDYEKTWENIKESTDGLLQAPDDDAARKAKRRLQLASGQRVKLGVMRHLMVIVDSSKAMKDKDLKPNRHVATLKMLENFVLDFFDHNPISQLGIIATKNGKAEKVIELGCNVSKIISVLKSHSGTSCDGEPSLQNSCEMALRALKNTPTHISKEILVLLGSITSCDPGDIQDTIKNLKSSVVRCSVVGLAAEVRICKVMSQRTEGKYNVIINEPHFREILSEHVRPPVAKSITESSLLKMGFPLHSIHGVPSLCVCHLNTPDSKLSESGFFCPQCHSKYCELPIDCIICGFTLVLAPHLSRSNRHLSPLPAFVERQLSEQLPCRGCQVSLAGKGYQCTGCASFYCIDCDIYMHETLYFCPSCKK